LGDLYVHFTTDNDVEVTRGRFAVVNEDTSGVTGKKFPIGTEQLPVIFIHQSQPAKVRQGGIGEV
jgi:hypothetical protein